VCKIYLSRSACACDAEGTLWQILKLLYDKCKEIFWDGWFLLGFYLFCVAAKALSMLLLRLFIKLHEKEAVLEFSTKKKQKSE
jgi:hypothetical protein